MHVDAYIRTSQQKKEKENIVFHTNNKVYSASRFLGSELVNWRLSA